MSHEEWSPPHQEPVPTPKPQSLFIILALLVPVIAAVGLIFADSWQQGLIIGIGMVFLSSLLVYLDARQFGNIDARGKKQTEPFVMMVASWVLWILFYPWSFVRRARFTGPNLSLMAVLVAVIFVAGPLLYSYLVPPGLPACDSKEVKQLIHQIVRSSSPLAASVTLIDDYQEISFDEAAQKRVGQCTLHTKQGKEPLKYTVEWQGKDKTHIYVKTMVELPLCTSLEARNLLEQILRTTALGKELKTIDGHRELSYDAQKEERQCQAVLHTPQGKVTIKYLLNWQNKEKGMFQVLVMP